MTESFASFLLPHSRAFSLFLILFLSSCSTPRNSLSTFSIVHHSMVTRTMYPPEHIPSLYFDSRARYEPFSPTPLQSTAPVHSSATLHHPPSDKSRNKYVSLSTSLPRNRHCPHSQNFAYFQKPPMAIVHTHKTSLIFKSPQWPRKSLLYYII